MRIGGVATLLALLSACGGSSPLPRDSFYRLVVPRDIHPVSVPPLAGTLVVKRFSADGLIGQRPVAYAKASDPHTLYQYHYHFWTDVPTRLLQDYAVDFLRQSVAAERVITPQLGLAADFQLLGKIRRLEFLQGSAPAVAVSLRLSVIQTASQALLLDKTYTLKRPVKGPDLVSASATMNRLLAEIFKRFEADLSGL